MAPIQMEDMVQLSPTNEDATAPAGLLSLPGEIRNIIYDELHNENVRYSRTELQTQDRRCLSAQFLRTNSQIHAEASSILYGTQILRYRLYESSIDSPIAPDIFLPRFAERYLPFVKTCEVVFLFSSHFTDSSTIVMQVLDPPTDGPYSTDDCWDYYRGVWDHRLRAFQSNHCLLCFERFIEGLVHLPLSVKMCWDFLNRSRGVCEAAEVEMMQCFLVLIAYVAAKTYFSHVEDIERKMLRDIKRALWGDRMEEDFSWAKAPTASAYARFQLQLSGLRTLINRFRKSNQADEKLVVRETEAQPEDHNGNWGAGHIVTKDEVRASSELTYSFNDFTKVHFWPSTLYDVCELAQQRFTWFPELYLEKPRAVGWEFDGTDQCGICGMELPNTLQGRRTFNSRSGKPPIWWQMVDSALSHYLGHIRAGSEGLWKLDLKYVLKHSMVYSLRKVEASGNRGTSEMWKIRYLGGTKTRLEAPETN